MHIRTIFWGITSCDGFGPPWLGVGDMAKYIYIFFFRNITIYDFITILCEVVFSILQVVWAFQTNLFHYYKDNAFYKYNTNYKYT